MQPSLKPRPLHWALVLIGLTSVIWTSQANAVSLVQAYEAALQNDASYRSAFYANEAGKENRALGMSNLLPSVNGSYNASQNRTTVETGKNISPYDYISRSSTVQLRQSLFNLEGWFRFKQGSAQAKYTEAQFNSQQQEVIVRVISADRKSTRLNSSH